MVVVFVEVIVVDIGLFFCARGWVLSVRLMDFTPQLSTSGTAASVVGSSDVSGVMLGEFPPAFRVLTASFARLAVVVVIHVVTLATTKRTRC
jgi:hypothetical protein